MRTDLNRRAFLKHSTALGAAAMAGAAAKAQSAPAIQSSKSPNEEIRTAIIGIRGQGKAHIAYQSACEKVRIATLCDCDENLFAERVKLVGEPAPKTETELRRVLDDKDIDCVVIAMPNHWHALATIWACQAGKDVYVEKPASYCISEGRKMVQAAAKYNRIIQHGTQLRAQTGRQKAIQLLREGVIGDIHMCRATVFRPRASIGRKADCPVPAGVNYDAWQGPAPEAPFNPNRFHYEWHWNWTYGNGEIGNNGPHIMDLVAQGLNKEDRLPTNISSHGGRYVWDDQGQTPNTQLVTYQYDDGVVVSLDVRNLESNDEVGNRMSAVFYGSKGYMVISVRGEYEIFQDGKSVDSGKGGGAHRELAANFYEAVRSRDKSKLLAPIEYGHTAAALCHLGNIAYRLNRSVNFDPDAENFGKDEQANALLSRNYRSPYVVPESV